MQLEQQSHLTSSVGHQHVKQIKADAAVKASVGAWRSADLILSCLILPGLLPLPDIVLESEWNLV